MNLSCISLDLAGHSSVDVVQSVGQWLVPLAAIGIVLVVSRRHPTATNRWSSRRVYAVLGKPALLGLALLILGVGLSIFGTGILMPVEGMSCAHAIQVVSAAGLLTTLTGALLSGVIWAVITQAGWVVLATFFALDLWIVFGMVMMNLKDAPEAPDAMLLLAFAMHAVCMYLTTVWAFRARDLNAMAQIRAGEAGRSIGAVWVFLAAYIVVSFFHNETGPFDSANGGAVLSALTLSALALTMGSGYTRYREVMAEKG